MKGSTRYFSCCCNQTPDREQFEEGRVSFGLQFKGTQLVTVLKADGRSRGWLVTLYPTQEADSEWGSRARAGSLKDQVLVGDICLFI